MGSDVEDNISNGEDSNTWCSQLLASMHHDRNCRLHETWYKNGRECSTDELGILERSVLDG